MIRTTPKKKSSERTIYKLQILWKEISTTERVNNSSCQFFDVQQDAKSIDPMILKIQDMIQ